MIRKLFGRLLPKKKVTQGGAAQAVSRSPLKRSENYQFSDKFTVRGMINGVAVPFFCTPEFRAEVQGKFKLRPRSDIFIVTYPESGTTWTQQIVRELLFKNDSEYYAEMMLSNRIPMIDAPSQMQLDVVEQMPSPRVFKAHNSTLEELDDIILKGDRSSKFIYVYRDPRDVAVSLYCEVRGNGLTDFARNACFDEFYETVVRNENEVFYGLWEAHLENWLSKRNELNMLVLNYETMNENPRNEIKRIAKFLNLKPTEEQIEDVAAKTTLACMKNEPNVVGNEINSVLRTGTVGDWENHFVDKSEAEKMEKIAKEVYEKYKLNMSM